MVNGIVILAAVALLFGGFARIREWRLRPKRSFLILLGSWVGLAFWIFFLLLNYFREAPDGWMLNPHDVSSVLCRNSAMRPQTV